MIWFLVTIALALYLFLLADGAGPSYEEGPDAWWQ